MNFQDLSLIPPIQQAVAEEGYQTPTDIQRMSIPIILKKQDMIGCAQTGTGKTAAFAIPILQLLSENIYQKPRCRALILTPTRELALQIEENFRAYGRHLKLKVTTLFGGVSAVPQVEALRKGVDIIIATPGRLLDLIQQKQVDLSALQMFVLDEADRMLDMGFIHDVKKVVSLLPTQRQTLFFSATMPPAVRKLANTLLQNPSEVTVHPVSSTAERIQQSVYYVEKKDKANLLVQVLLKENMNRSLVFTRTKHGADRLVKQLSKQGIQARAIHGNKSQQARQKALSDFRNNDIGVLVATDIAARGIDIDELPLVVNYEIPEVPETYVHRIGRTGRAGMEGTAISFCDTEERDDFKNIQRLIGMTLPVLSL